MPFDITPKQIADILHSPLGNVEEHWPHLKAALEQRGIKYPSGYIAALATIGVECRVFQPIDEYGGEKYFFRMYDIKGSRPQVARQLGNLTPGDGARFHGRGWIQLTGRHNYTQMSDIVSVDLVEHPEKAKEEPYASLIFAEYLASRGCDVWAQKASKDLVSCAFCKMMKRPAITEAVCPECCWKMVRRKVNGGLNHYREFRSFVSAFLSIAPPTPQNT